MPQPLLFTPIQIRGLTLKNRIVIAPMHQYSAVEGYPTDWHLMNVGRFAAGGAGLTFVESTKVERRGCGTIGDTGLWHDDFIPHFRRLADFIKQSGSAAAIQLGHSGRKARRFRPWEGGRPLTPQPEVKDWEDWELVAPSAEAANNQDPTPRALSRDEIHEVIAHWGQAAARANSAGFDVLEIHGAHGYLIHQFLSPFANRRNDEYGGSEENRMRFATQIVETIRGVWPEEKPLFMRLSVEDDAGWGPEQSAALGRIVKPLGVDVIDCSSGGMRGAPVVDTGPITYGYQVPYSDKVRRDADIMTMAVGLIVHPEHAEQILQDNKADLIAIAREALYNPNWPMDAAYKLGIENPFDTVPSPYSYWLAKRDSSVEGFKPSTYHAGHGIEE